MNVKKMLFDKTNGFNIKDFQKLSLAIQELPNSLWEIEIGKPKRTGRQNKALHKFCSIVASELNGVGATFKSISILNGTILEAEWDERLVKEHIWRPVQVALLKKKSTTSLKTNELDTVAKPIIDTLTKKFGFGLLFPSQLSLQLEEEAKTLPPEK